MSDATEREALRNLAGVVRDALACRRAGFSDEGWRYLRAWADSAYGQAVLDAANATEEGDAS